ncbi:MAG: hypothetical protein HDS66_00905 [Bacteroidales bacterium]|nr:hypothetical protein [Bacteroidales bacterium]
MSLLADDFFDNWVDWKVELYSAISHFANDPTEENHDLIAKALREQAGDEVKLFDGNMPNPTRCVIAICKPNRKRDAVAIMGPSCNSGRYVNTWKCSKHTPLKMRSQWVERKYSWSGSGLYINQSPKFRNEHEVYEIPKEVYDALCVQFKEL